MESDFFAANRNNLISRMGGGAVVLTAYSSLQLTGDAEVSFRQEANFWYLTGIEEPDWQLIVDGARGKSWLVAPHVSDVTAIFNGSLSKERAKEMSGVDAVILRDEADDLLREIAKKHSLVYSLDDDPHAKYYSFILNPAQKKLWNRLDRIFNDVQDCRGELAKLRAIKQPKELMAMKKAINLTVEAFTFVKDQLSQLHHEYEVEAEFTYHFRHHGAEGHAYDPIVASGKNACTLHYGSNNSKLKKGTLLLLDIGARTDGYAADITRTYAIGKPGKRAAAVHSAVVRAHNDIVELLTPGLSVVEYYQSVDTIMQRELVGLGLMKSLTDIDNYRRYFPHAISHGLGVDVHDALGRPTEFLQGMVLTVEPGIYIPEEGIGVRLEDDILITDSGHLNLSKALSLDI